MTKFTKGQTVKVVNGKHAGKEAWFDKQNAHRTGKCFVQFKRVNYNAAQVNLSDLVAE